MLVLLIIFNRFEANISKLYPLKASAKLWFSDTLRDMNGNTGIKWVAKTPSNNYSQIFKIQDLTLSSTVFNLMLIFLLKDLKNEVLLHFGVKAER